MPEFQTAYMRTQHTPLDCGEGLTEQSHKNETDMNYILRDYTRTGFIRHAKDNQGQYDDVTVQDFQQAMFIVKEAENMFNELPGQVRKRFMNNPAGFLEFVQNPQNAAEMQKMGILRGNDGIDMQGVPTTAPIEPPKASPPPETNPPSQPA